MRDDDGTAAGTHLVADIVWHYRDRAPRHCRWHSARFPGKDHWAVASPALYDGLMALFEPVRAILDDRSITTFAELEQRYDRLQSQFHAELRPTGNVIARVASRIAMEGHVEQALAFLAKAAEQAANGAQIALMRGDVLAEAGRFDEAIRCLEAAQTTYVEEGAFFVSIVSRALEDVKAKQAAKEGADSGQ